MTSFTTTIAVAEPPERVFEAIRDVQAWWSGSIEGGTSEVDDEFSYEVPGIHWCKIRVTEVDAPRKVSWLVLDSWLTFIEDKGEYSVPRVLRPVLARVEQLHRREPPRAHHHRSRSAEPGT